MSGLHHHRWERGPHYGLGRGLKEGAWTWSHALREAGHGSGLFGKTHCRPLHAKHGFGVMQLCDHNLRWAKTQGDPRWRDDDTEWTKARGLEKLVDPETGRKTSSGAVGGFEWPHHIDLHPISGVRDRAIEYIEERAGNGGPFAVIVSFRLPHTP